MAPMNPPMRCAARLFGFSVAVIASVALTVAPTARADPEDCQEEISLSDPYDLVSDSDRSVDFGTLLDVESLVDDYTAKIDEALDAEYDGLEPPEGMSSDDLIDEARWEVDDAVDLGTSIAGCED